MKLVNLETVAIALFVGCICMLMVAASMAAGA